MSAVAPQTDYTDDLRLAHVLADDADSLTTTRFKALDLHVISDEELIPLGDGRAFPKGAHTAGPQQQHPPAPQQQQVTQQPQQHHSL